jgi:hypothetical protein
MRKPVSPFDAAKNSGIAQHCDRRSVPPAIAHCPSGSWRCIIEI